MVSGIDGGLSMLSLLLLLFVLMSFDVGIGKEERSWSFLRVASTAENALSMLACKKDIARELLLPVLFRLVDGVGGPDVGSAAEGEEHVSQGRRACAATDSRGEEST